MENDYNGRERSTEPMARSKFRNPLPAVDIIIEIADGRKRPGVVLIDRKNPPPGWALPGGFVDYGESLEAAAVREAREETSLDVELLGQLGSYSDPSRDPRFHTISTVFLARAKGLPRGADDARSAIVFDPRDRSQPLAFDHAGVLAGYFTGNTGPPTSLPRERRKRGPAHERRSRQVEKDEARRAAGSTGRRAESSELP
jgi:ADP-ribose pyrophosphatase YjhB (NUDIX family)